MYGLLDRDIKSILEVMSKFSEIEEAIIFGSRAIGNYKKGSDIDIAIKGVNITRRIIRRVSDALNEEYPIPYFFDIIHYESLDNKKLIDHIDIEGKIIYLKNELI
ncbi:MAG: nucleotidyltransferase domain-containing protein [Tissierellales bacterium]|jgi:predicted nucleotidyltransferase|nr:nucleotidyltransferase domain-containing protein [Tissierellales bacterium]